MRDQTKEKRSEILGFFLTAAASYDFEGKALGSPGGFKRRAREANPFDKGHQISGMIIFINLNKRNILHPNEVDKT